MAQVQKIQQKYKDLSIDVEPIPVTSLIGKLGNNVLRIIVGDGVGQREFAVHQPLICESSHFFERLLKNEWKEAMCRMIKLPEDDPVIFGAYLQALYTGRIKTKDYDDVGYSANLSWDFAPLLGDTLEIQTAGPIIEIWAKVYALAEKLIDRRVKTLVLEEMYADRQYVWRQPLQAANAAKIIFESTPGLCPMRRLSLDMMVYYRDENMTTKDFLSALDIMPKELLEQVIIAMSHKMSRVVLHAPCDRYPSRDTFYDYLGIYTEEDSEKGDGESRVLLTKENGLAIYSLTCAKNNGWGCPECRQELRPQW